MPSSYFQDIADGIRTTAKGLSLTLRHVWAARRRRMPGDIRTSGFFEQTEGMVTIQYPLEAIPIPDNGRYRLHNEMDDCIVCDKCAKVCPVDCIDIEPIRATEEVGKASDGSPIRLYAAKFDIDMAKCCYCGLCTTVCPTECLTMTKTFDYSELDVRDMVYEFGNLTPAEAEEKKRLLEQFQKEKEALKTAAKAAPGTSSDAGTSSPRPAFRPGMKPKTAEAESTLNSPENTPETTSPAKPKVPFRPGMKPAKAQVPQKAEDSDQPKPATPFRPTMKPKEEPTAGTSPSAAEENKEATPTDKPKVPFRPTMKPPKAAAPDDKEGTLEVQKPKVPFRPTMKPKQERTSGISDAGTPESAETTPSEKPKVPFRPTMKPAIPKQEKDPPAAPEAKTPEAPEKPKVPFRPSMKPKTRPGEPPAENE